MTLNPAFDGVDHINVYSRGRTRLGQFLSNFAYHPFVHPKHGEFVSVEGLWYWLPTHNDRLRTLYGYSAKRLGRELRAPDWPQGPEFRRDVADGIRAKLISKPVAVEALMRTDLPLVHYYVSNDSINDQTAKCRWMLGVIEEFR